MNLRFFINKPTGLMNLDGKLAVVTGANAGIGYEISKQLAELNCEIVMGCRNEENARKAIETIKTDTANEKLTFFKLDFMSLESVREFANNIENMGRKIDILVNNAGIYYNEPVEYTADGYEKCFQVNYLGHVLLLDLIKAKLAETARIVNLASFYHAKSPSLKRERLEQNFLVKNCANQSLSGHQRYCATKLAFVYLTKYLEKSKKSKGISIFAINPGLVATKIMESKILESLVRLLFIGPDKGAYTAVFAAASQFSPKYSGEYLNNCERCDTSKNAQDTKLQEDCMNFTFDQLGIKDLII